MIGRRIQHVEDADPYHELDEPGDYCLAASAGSDPRPSVWFIVPWGSPPWAADPAEGYAPDLKHIARCAMPPHVFRECADGSLEIRESILVTQRWKGREWRWHGYLDEGHVWRTV